MKHSKSVYVVGASLVKEDNLKDFVKFLSKQFNEIEYAGKLIDGTRILFSSFDELISYQNFNNRSLVELDVSCYDGEAIYERKKSLNIYFSDSGLFLPATIRYNLQYEERDWGFGFEDDLANELKEFRPYYNYFSFLNLTIGLPKSLLKFLKRCLLDDYFESVAGTLFSDRPY